MGQIQAKDLSGCMVALVTPMNPDGSINFSEWERLIQWHIDNRTDAIVVAGTTGESSLLSKDEIESLSQSAVKLCQQSPTTKVIIGTGGIDPNHVIAANKLAKKNGADAVLIVTPYYLTLTQQALIEHFTAIAEQTELPIILYNVPTRTVNDLTSSTTAQLAKIQNIIGIKEAKSDMGRIDQLVKIKNFAVLSGDDGTFIEAMKRGAHGVISVAANVRPQAIKDLCNHMQLGDIEQANSLNTELSPLYDYLFHEPNPCPVKSLMHHTNMISSGIRKPLVMTEIKKNQVKPFTPSIIQEFSSI
ncbi:4-hydroxy-tetrahydrodipicolinate synthase [Marinicella litoralis]|uniref:4-hydroxy-tetrahydrodipicolinate synthase n=1 Tax=Marinicella litoralis TaxID=644220 RepID=A0A4R6XW44_9GAMM|nr:4-hydroxy-tetrahydrodipicolinate synthase [Marinicella litoralis]TDR22789.1 4-hydroxy-tetrahydrodipicolinate synthase [Marinicella litoralis]